MAEKKEKVEKPKKVITKSKPKYKTNLHVLLQDVEVSGKIIKKGTKYPLTEKGAEYFKSKFYIK